MSQIPVKLLVNGRVYSPTHPEATAMAVRGDVVAWLGSDDVGRDQFPDADVQDLDGRFVAPGFVDSHIHLTATGLMLSGLDCGPRPHARSAYGWSPTMRPTIRVSRCGVTVGMSRPGRRMLRPAPPT